MPQILWRLTLIGLLTLFIGHPLSALALETTDVLPKGVRSLQIRAGTVSGLNQQYTDSGQLKYLHDLNSQELNATTLSRIEPAVSDLVRVLNQFGHHRLGNQINLGHLYVDSMPKVSYFAPIFLYGITSRLSLGIGAPIIKYSNTVNVGHQGSNLQTLRNEVGGLVPEIDAAFDQLNKDMKAEFRSYVESRGYKPLSSVEKSFLGDVQLVAAYQFEAANNLIHATNFFLSLPTGPKPDPDDLTDIESFGRWAARSTWISAYRLTSRSSLIGSASYQAVFPGRMVKRVPLSEQDPLPNASTKFNLNEDIGDSWALSQALSHRISQELTCALAYSFESKMRDKYSGAPEGRGHLLEKNTDRSAHLGKIELAYSSVENFKGGRASVPWTISYELSKVLSGINIENQTRHELWMSLYF